MQTSAITITDTGRADGNEPTCLLAVAALSYHNQGGEFIELLGVCPQRVAWQLAVLYSRERGLAIIGPRSPVAIKPEAEP
jgi:hypothetical protein